MTISDYFRDYAGYHQTRGNRITHWVGIPCIVTSLLGLLSHLGTPTVNGGLALWLLGTLWYLKLDWKIGAPFSLVTLGAYLVGTVIPLPWLLALFVGGWIVQLLGHSYFEKNRPALLTNFRHTLVGPLWLFSKLIRYQ